MKFSYKHRFFDLKYPKRYMGCDFKNLFKNGTKTLHKTAYTALFYSIFAILWLFIPQIGSAEPIPRTNFLSYGPGISSTAMGDVATANGDDMSVFYYNPSLLVTLPCPEISAGYWFLYGGARYNFVGFSTKGKYGAVALAGTQLFRGDIEVREKIDDEPTLANNNQMAVYGSYAIAIRKIANLGISLKYINQSIHTQLNSCLSFDTGISKQLFTLGNPSERNLKVNTGFVIQNLYREINLTGTLDGNNFPQTLKFGVGMKATIIQRYNKKTNVLTYDSFSLACDIIRRERQNSFFFGGSYDFMGILILRAGWNNGITAGIGVNYQNYRLDYAIVPSEFTYFHKIGFGYKIKQQVTAQEEVLQSKFRKEFQKVYSEARRLYNKHYKEALRLSKKKEYAKAAELLEITTPLMPDKNKKAVELLEICLKAIKAVETIPGTSTSRSINSASEDKGSDTFAPRIYPVRSTSAQQDVKDKDVNQRPDTNNQMQIHSLVKDGISAMKNNNYSSAYEWFSSASRLAPTDAGIRDHMEMAKQKFLKEKKFTLADKLYADKLYYLAAIKIATNESAEGLISELKSFNPLYDFIHLLERSGE